MFSTRLILGLASVLLLIGCGAQPIHWYASPEFVPAMSSKSETVPAKLVLKIENMQKHVSMPSNDKRAHFITLEYNPSDVLRVAWHATVNQWASEKTVDQYSCVPEVAVVVTHMRVKHGASGVGLGYDVPRVYIDIKVGTTINEEEFLSVRKISEDIIGPKFSAFTTSKRERSEIYSRMAFEALVKAFDQLIGDIAATLPSNCGS